MVIFVDDKILLSHGSGGQMTHELFKNLLLPAFANPMLNTLDDAAVIETVGRLAFSTDSFVVQPIFFPGGDIGKLAVCGTVNDLSMMGAVPKFLSVALIIEEGLLLDDLRKIVDSMKRASQEAGVNIVTGDTKVVDRGSVDKIFINTAGIGIIPPDVNLSGNNVRAGDVIIMNGTIGDHGIAVLSQRPGMDFGTIIKSDCAPLNGLVASMLEASRNIHCLRDPTRGGLAATLNEIAGQSAVSICIEEDKIPVHEAVNSACEMLGLDPLCMANEGKLIAMVAANDAEAVLGAMHSHVYGRQAAIIGWVKTEHPGRVVIKTRFGASRIIDMPVGEILPRIC
jgi:hydrogenase expression/formation protein HypE